MAYFTIAEFLAWLKLKLCLLLLPVYVWPREYVRSWIRRVAGQQQPLIAHLLANATIRWLSAMLSVEQFNRVTSGSTSISDMFRTWDQFQQLGTRSEEIVRSEFRATFVVTVPESTHLILYVHGGGFVSGSTTSTSKYLLQLFLELQHRGLLCDILSVDYDLAPGARYPAALQQVAHAYRFAASLGKPIILMGDSAGGNLCLGLLQHIVHANPLMKKIPTEVERSIVAVRLVSPWVNLRTGGPSVEMFRNVDCLDKSVLDSWAQHYVGPEGKLDCYASPAERKTNWASILPMKTLFIAGEMELFLSDILKFVENIRRDGVDSVLLSITPNKGHAWPAVDFGFEGAKGPLGVKNVEVDSVIAGLQLQADWMVEVVGI